MTILFATPSEVFVMLSTLTINSTVISRYKYLSDSVALSAMLTNFDSPGSRGQKEGTEIPDR